MKRCPRCRVLKPLSKFWVARNKGPGARAFYCKPCNNAAAAAWHRANDPKHPRIPKPLAARLLSHATQEGRCWVWEGAIQRNGYGVIGIGSLTDGSRRMEYVHRVSYSLFVGPIPEGLQIDHLCSNKRCLQPDHLEPVTRSENQLRANAVRHAEALAS